MYNQEDAHVGFAELTGQTGDAIHWLGDSVPGGFFAYRNDSEQGLLYANRATLQIFGCESLAEFNALTGGTFKGMVHPDDYAAIQESIDQQIADEANENFDFVEYRIIRKDGEVRWVDDYGRLAHLPDFGDVYYVFISDVTDKRSEHDAKVRTEIALMRELRANEATSSFIFNLSHDIRTPMNAIVGYSELAQRHIDDQTRLSDYLGKTVDASRQLLHLIDDMLEMSRIGGGAVGMEPERMNVREQIGKVVDLFRINAANKQIALQVDLDLGDEQVIADLDSFRRIGSNLMDNAVKFTPPGGTISISARRLPSAKAEIAQYEITVADTGRGMSEEFMERMYGAFEREHSSTQSGLRGSGLGLTIVKGLIDLLGGSIAAESKLGVGTKFTMTMPLRLYQGSDEQASGFAGTAFAKRGMEGRRILIVDDVKINRELVKAVLEDEGFVTDTAENGYEAVEAMKHHRLGYYDLILMDIQMPVMDGYDATKAIRALLREDALHVPIVALSANAREEDVAKSLASGMNCHVAKPFDAAGLIAVITEHIAAAESAHFGFGGASGQSGDIE